MSLQDLHRAAVDVRDALGVRGVSVTTVALPEAATAITGRVGGTVGGARLGVLFHHDRAPGRAAIDGLLGALDARDGVPPGATLVFLSDGERAAGSPTLAEYLDTLADRLAAEVWIVAGGLDGPVVGGEATASVARVLDIWEAAGGPVGSSSVVEQVRSRLDCPVVGLPDADAGRWRAFFAALLAS